MPRVARNVVINVPYHIIHRGNNKQKIFYSEDDNRYFLSLVKEAKNKYHCHLYAYVLMPNHIHLLLESKEYAQNLAKFIKLLAQKYAQYINKKYQRTGTLWEGRFKSSPISNDDYLLTCSRYIETNPVRAGITENPADYRWSSHRYKIGIEEYNFILDMDPLYLDLSKTDQERQKRYADLFKDRTSLSDKVLVSIRGAINKNSIFGNDQFKAYMEKITGREFVIRKKGRPSRY